MKITKQQLKRIVKEELSRALKLKESIGVDTWDKLEAVLESNREVFAAAYEEGIRSYDSEQVDANTGERVSSDPHTEVMNQIMSLIEPYLNPGPAGPLPHGDDPATGHQLPDHISPATDDKFTYGGMTEDKNDPAYQRGRKDGKAGIDKEDGMKAERDNPNGSVDKYEKGWLSGHTLRVTGGA